MVISYWHLPDLSYRLRPKLQRAGIDARVSYDFERSSDTMFSLNVEVPMGTDHQRITRLVTKAEKEYLAWKP